MYSAIIGNAEALGGIKVLHDVLKKVNRFFKVVDMSESTTLPGNDIWLFKPSQRKNGKMISLIDDLIFNSARNTKWVQVHEGIDASKKHRPTTLSNLKKYIRNA